MFFKIWRRNIICNIPEKVGVQLNNLGLHSPLTHSPKGVCGALSDSFPSRGVPEERFLQFVHITGRKNPLSLDWIYGYNKNYISEFPHLMIEKWYLKVVLIPISLMSKDESLLCFMPLLPFQGFPGG